MEHITTDAQGIVQTCPACGQPNRVPYAHIGETGQCGKCGAEIPAPAAPIEVNSVEHFEQLIEGDLPVVVDFWAPWCGPCRMVAPELEKVAAGANGQFVIAKVDTETVPDLAERYYVMSIPTLSIFQHGREKTRVTGARPAAAIRSFIDQSTALAAAR